MEALRISTTGCVTVRTQLYTITFAPGGNVPIVRTGQDLADNVVVTHKPARPDVPTDIYGVYEGSRVGESVIIYDADTSRRIDLGAALEITEG